MEATVYYPSYRLFLANLSESTNIYDDGYPTEEGYITYSIVTPIICAFGILGNAISLVVLNRRELKGSVYVYLAVLAFSDLCSSILLFLSGLSCGVFFINSTWPIYDILLGLPLAILFNTMSVLTTIMVTFDRICYLSNPLRRRKPKFCHAFMARRIMIICFLISLFTTIPYCFIFISSNNDVKPRNFFYSSFYSTYNWMRFIIFGVLPSIFLTCGNGYLIYALRKLKKFYGKCNSMKCKKPENYTNLTTTLILIVFIFVISQIPSMLVNRATASTFFFPTANSEDSCNSKLLENIREVSTVLTAVRLSSDFVLYYLFCPSFCKVLAKLFRSKKKKCKPPPVQMNVFVLDKQICFNGDNNDFKAINELTAGKLFQMIDSDSNRDSLPSSIYDGSFEEEPKPNRDTLITICSNNL